MRKQILALAVIAASACGSPKPAPPVAPVSNAGDGTAAPPADTTDVVIVALVTDSGPIGDGRCSQRSYEVSVQQVVSGELPGPEKRWVHFEACGDVRPTMAVGGTALDQGTTYTLTLRRGASPNFGDDYMIVDARP